MANRKVRHPERPSRCRTTTSPPTRPTGSAGSRHLRRGIAAPGGDARRQRRRVRHRALRDGRHPPGHRPHRRAGTGPHPARHDHRLRRQPHLDPWGLRALAFGIGTSEVEHVLATQTLRMPRSKNMRVTVDGTPGRNVGAKDIALAIIGRIGTAGGTGHVIEYAGAAIRALSMEGRMTLCNMSIEAGARAGLVAPTRRPSPISKAAPRPQRARRGRWRSPTGRRCSPTRRPPSTPRSCSTPPTSPRSSPGAPARRTSRR